MLSDIQIQRMKDRELVCCSHLLDFCTRHLVIQNKSEFISDTSRPILSYHLVPPLTTRRYFGLSLRSVCVCVCVCVCVRAGGGEKFCTRHCSNTRTIGKDRRSGSRASDPHSESLDESQRRAPFSRCALLECRRIPTVLRYYRLTRNFA